MSNEEQIIGIYLITSPDNKYYVGQSTNINERFKHYKCLYNKKQPLLYKSFLVFGADNHNFDILESCYKQDLNFLESFYITYFKFLGVELLNISQGTEKARELSALIKKEKIKVLTQREEISKRFDEVLRAKLIAPNTASVYNSHLNHFLNWCKDKNCDPVECQKHDLIEYLSINDNYHTLKQRKGMLYNFFEFVACKPYLTYGLPCAKQPNHIPDYFTPQELYGIFSLVKNTKQICILKTQYALGLRVSEVVSIKRKDFIKKFNPEINKAQWDIKIRGKGSKDRILPVPDETMDMIKDYWKSLPISDQHPIFLFKGQFCSHYSVKSVQLIIKRAMNTLGIIKQGSSHLIRKSRASHFGQNGVDAKYIKDFLGHAGFKYVDCYVKLNTEHLRKSFGNADAKILPLLNQPLQLPCNR